MRDWIAKARFKLLYLIASAIAIEPFLKINENAYCPCCGHELGKINAVVLTGPDESGSKVGVLHTCATCKFLWIEPSVTIIKNHALASPLDEEDSTVQEMVNDKRTKNIRSTVKVNGNALAS